MLRFLLIALVLLVLCGCAAPSPPSARLEPARKAVARAYAAGAPDLAHSDYRRARAKLEQGERLDRQGESDKADIVLKQAIFFARRADRKAQAAWDADSDAEARKAQAKGQAADPSVPEQVQDGVATTDEGAEQVRAEPRRQQPPQKPELNRKAASTEDEAKPEPAPNPKAAFSPPEEYVVRDGETLWTIAARRVIYRDALLWPLIYKANRDQIKDPRQIFPQQVLTIPRNVSDAEREEAREKARRSEIFPVEVLLRQIADDDN